MAINPIRAPDPGSILAPRPGVKTPPGFSTALNEAIERVEAFQRDASHKVESFLSGENEDLHTVALATQRAELAFELFQQVRNKVVQAYQEVMRMQI
ncbi:MAG: flagellar hook-basal body complex protein FliE [Acidobacteria bacterium]|nr:flagellar hook-basal body complex protein FliE [Acidobacteriota bacterium]MBI3472127.1 flagellar hook-basal body complex protein FliE [Candidatus Solibacter usitatus]